MPTTISELLHKTSLDLAGTVKWGQSIPDNRPGIYVVSLSSSPEEKSSCLYDEAPIDVDAVERWLDAVPTLRLDGSRPKAEKLAERIARFWLPDESILYIGKASKSVGTRVKDFYRTTLGVSKPHAGGHWLKTLSLLNDLSIFWSITRSPESDEASAIEAFMEGVSPASGESLYDSEHPFPFANLELRQGSRRHLKKHGIEGAVRRKR